MENSLKALILAAGTVITCVVITLGFYLSKEAQSTASTGTSKIGKINSEFAENDKTMYDNVTVSGSEVVNAIKKLDGEFVGINVITNNSNDFYGYQFDISSGEIMMKSTKSYNQAISSSASNYINPYANFKGKVIRNGNNVITGVKFEQV